MRERLSYICINRKRQPFCLTRRIHVNMKGEVMKSGSKLYKFLNKEKNAGVIFCMPFIIGFVVFLVVPMGLSLYYSFCDYDILSPPEFIGLDNYIKMFTGDSVFWKSFKATVYFALVSVPLRLIFALLVALILVKPTKLTGLPRGILFTFLLLVVLSL